MRVCVFGCKKTTRHLISHLSRVTPLSCLVTLSPEQGVVQNVADYQDLEDLRGVVDEVYRVSSYNLKTETDRAFFEAKRYDVAFVAGWQRIIPDPILQTFPRGVYGMHGSSQNLPFGRGRSPLNWSIIEGREWFYTNLFRYLPGVDDGPVVGTACFSIQSTDTAETLHYKNILAMIHLVRANWAGLAAGNIELRPQPAVQATFYPQRKPDDGLVDWSDTVTNVDRLIRAVGPPFYGAFSYLGDQRVVIQRAAIFYTDLEAHPFASTAYGTVCDVFSGGKFLVRCNGGMIIVHEWTGSVQLTAGDVLRSPEDSIRRFARNVHGYFDLPCN